MNLQIISGCVETNPGLPTAENNLGRCYVLNKNLVNKVAVALLYLLVLPDDFCGNC